jgi:hypothetical protein
MFEKVCRSSCAPRCLRPIFFLDSPTRFFSDSMFLTDSESGGGHPPLVSSPVPNRNSRESTQRGKRKGRTMNPLIQLKKNTRVFLVRSLLGAATASLLVFSSPAQAGYIVTLQQVGPNVVATGSGAIDLSGLIFLTGGSSWVHFWTQTPDK